MTWRPLRVLAATIIYLRGKLKREHIIDVDLLPRDDDFLDQALRDRLPFLKREALQILAQQLAKVRGMIDDLLPMDGVVLRSCQLLHFKVQVV